MTTTNATSARSNPHPQDARTILVVEDNLEVLTVVEDFLRGEGFDPIGFVTGTDAIEWLWGHDADLMLLDLNLPDMTGTNLVSALKEKNQDLPFVVVTGRDDAKIAVEMMKLGARDYIQKGSNFFDYLLPVIHQAIADIDREKRLRISEEEQARLRERVLQAQKQESLGVLARGIAHNFNNILSTIIGYTRLAMDDVSVDSLTHANLSEVLKAGNRAKILVEQMLEFGRSTEPKREPLDLREAVSEALGSVEETLPEQIRVQRDLDVENAVVLANAGQINQMLVNLFENAVTAMADDGGILGVRLSKSESETQGESAPYFVRAGRHVVLTISDTGAGMSQDVRKKVFDPFFTTKNIGRGTGMGLAVVHGVVTAHGGVIDVHSELEKGTVFDIYLPQVPDGGKVVWEDIEPIGYKGKRILVIDDEEPLVRLADQILSRKGYEVITRTSSPEALLTFSEDPGNFHAVITDMLMPDLRGDELAEQMLALRPGLPIVLMTGSDYRKTREEAAALGFSECLPKPFTPESLSEAVRKALDAAGRD